MYRRRHPYDSKYRKWEASTPCFSRISTDVWGFRREMTCHTSYLTYRNVLFIGPQGPELLVPPVRGPVLEECFLAKEEEQRTGDRFPLVARHHQEPEPLIEDMLPKEFEKPDRLRGQPVL